ncbi:RNA polymerase sigma factor (sigma-70 family) [Streptacidiphilus sp. MAP12-33]|uniref:RNA polymerase sigma factor SigJ n=1 Tax=Streptacidiphilus sp. MAP12-33 TaxID=3156266 RepID=UPI003511136A
MTDATDPAARPAATPAATPADSLDAIAGERRHLLNLGYRLLGSLAEAEDAVQETYARWYAMSRQEQDAIAVPAAWLTRVAGRICLDQLASARVRRERYVGDWLPEPVPGPAEWLTGRPGSGVASAEAADPADRVTLDESVGMAFLVALEAMTPAQRVALILHDVFAYPFTEVAEVTGRTPAACRELASVARRRARAACPPGATPGSGGGSGAGAVAGGASTAEQAALVRDFQRVWHAQDLDGLIALLDPDAVFTADGGGVVQAAPHPIHGAARIAGFVVEVARHVTATAVVTLHERLVNGRPGLLVRIGDETSAVYAFDVAAGRITRIWAVRNPEKLRRWETE